METEQIPGALWGTGIWRIIKLHCGSHHSRREL